MNSIPTACEASTTQVMVEGEVGVGKVGVGAAEVLEEFRDGRVGMNEEEEEEEDLEEDVRFLFFSALLRTLLVARFF